MILTELFVILALIAVNGVFAGAEIAIVSLRRTRVQQLVDSSRAGARTVATLRAEPERFFATVQVGITVVTTTAAAFGGARIARNLEPLLRPLPVVGGHNADAVALVIVVVLISFLSLVLGELVPKSLALRRSERYALLVAKPLAVLSRIARPIVWLLTATSNLVLRPFSDRTNFSEARISKEELEQMVDEAAKTGAIHEHASELASRALDFDRLVLRDVMLPRARIDALPMRATMDQIRRFLLEERRSRIPVYDRSLDDIVGYVSAKDIVSLAWDGGPVVLADLLRNVHFFPETRVGHRGAALHAERAAAHRDRGRRARGRVGHGHVRGPGRGAGGRHLQRARGGRRAPDARARRRGRRARRHADPRRQPGARHRAGGAAGRHHAWRASASRWRAGSPTATPVWRRATGRSWWCSRCRPGPSSACASSRA